MFRQTVGRIAVVVSLVSLGSHLHCQVASAGQPTQFRGATGNGVYPEGLPVKWDAENGVKWSVDVPGGGWSAPIELGKTIILTTAVSDDGDRPKGFGEGVRSMGAFYATPKPNKPLDFQVLALDAATGKTLWSTSVTKQIPPHKIHPSNSYATESPVTDGKTIVVSFASIGVVAALDATGKTLWQRELGAFSTGNNFGTGSSLAFEDNLVFVQSDNEEKSFVTALDLGTGNEVWRDDRDSRTSWSSPIIWRNKDRTELVVCGSGTVTSYEPKTGKKLWTLSGMGGSFSASPTFDTERLYLGQSGRNSRGPLVAIKAGASGELTVNSTPEQGVAWVADKAAPGMCSPVVSKGKVYVLSRGIIHCYNAASGEMVYRERLQDAARVTSSLWAVGDRIFALNEAGQTLVVKAGDDFELDGTNTIEGLYWSTPSPATSALLLRSADKLHCISSQ